MIVYYNCELSGGRKDGTLGQYRNVSANVSLSSPLLQRQEDYTVSIIRCKIPLSLAMPLWITEFLTTRMIANPANYGWADGVNTPYWMQIIKQTDVVNTDPIPAAVAANPNLNPFYIPFIRSNFQDTNNLTLPLTKQPTDKRGFLYSYEQFTIMITSILQTCINTYNLNNPADAIPLYSCFYVSSTEKFVISPTLAGITPAQVLLVRNTRIIISPSLVQYLNGFNIIQYPDYSYISFARVGADGTIYQNWSPQFQAIQSIVITSSILVLPEYSQKIIRQNPPSVNQFGIVQLQQDFDQVLILQDFVFDGTQPNAFCTPLVYNSATVKYSREVAILGSGPLQYFNINVMWVDSNGLLRQMETNDTQSSNILLAFIPRT